MQGNTLIDLLVLLGSPAFMAVLSKWAESWAWLQRLNSNGKLAVIVGLSAAVAMGAYALTEALTGRPDILGAIDPYVKIAWPFVNLIVSQFRYGNSAAAKRINPNPTP